MQELEMLSDLLNSKIKKYKKKYLLSFFEKSKATEKEEQPSNLLLQAT